jgi:hypothetical protein
MTGFVLFVALIVGIVFAVKANRRLVALESISEARDAFRERLSRRVAALEAELRDLRPADPSAWRWHPRGGRLSAHPWQ